MNWLVFERATGIVVGSLKGDARPTVMDHHNVCEYHGALITDYSTVRIKDGVCVEAPDVVEIVRDHALRRVNNKRTAIQNDGCTTTKGVMQSDEGSRLLLSGAVQMAQIAVSQGQDFSIGWTMEDNTTVQLTAAELIAAGVAMGSFIATAHGVAVALKAQINAAKTVAEITAIDIDAAQWRGPSMVTMKAQKGVTVTGTVKV